MLHCHLYQIWNGASHYLWDPWQWHLGSFSSTYDSDHAGLCRMGEACNDEMWTRYSPQPNHYVPHNWVSASGIGESLLFSTPSRSWLWIHKLLLWQQPHLKAYLQSKRCSVFKTWTCNFYRCSRISQGSRGWHGAVMCIYWGGADNLTKLSCHQQELWPLGHFLWCWTTPTTVDNQLISNFCQTLVLWHHDSHCCWIYIATILST